MLDGRPREGSFGDHAVARRANAQPQERVVLDEAAIHDLEQLNQEQHRKVVSKEKAAVRQGECAKEEWLDYYRDFALVKLSDALLEQDVAEKNDVLEQLREDLAQREGYEQVKARHEQWIAEALDWAWERAQRYTRASDAIVQQEAAPREESKFAGELRAVKSEIAKGDWRQVAKATVRVLQSVKPDERRAFFAEVCDAAKEQDSLGDERVVSSIIREVYHFTDGARDEVFHREDIVAHPKDVAMGERINLRRVFGMCEFGKDEEEYAMLLARELRHYVTLDVHALERHRRLAAGLALWNEKNGGGEQGADAERQLLVDSLILPIEHDAIDENTHVASTQQHYLRLFEIATSGMGAESEQAARELRQIEEDLDNWLAGDTPQDAAGREKIRQQYPGWRRAEFAAVQSGLRDLVLRLDSAPAKENVDQTAALEAVETLDPEKTLREDRANKAVAGGKETKLAYLVDTWRRLAKLDHPEWREARPDFERWAKGDNGYVQHKGYEGFSSEDFAKILHEAADGRAEVPRPDERAIHEALSHLWRKSWRKMGKNIASLESHNAKSLFNVAADNAIGELRKFVQATDPKYVGYVNMHEGAFVGWTREDFIALSERFNHALAEKMRELGLAQDDESTIRLHWEDVGTVEAATERRVSDDEVDEIARKHVLKNPTELFPDPNAPDYHDWEDDARRFKQTFDAAEYVHWRDEDFDRLVTKIKEIRDVEREGAHKLREFIDELGELMRRHGSIHTADQASLALIRGLEGIRTPEAAQMVRFAREQYGYFAEFAGALDTMQRHIKQPSRDQEPLSEKVISDFAAKMHHAASEVLARATSFHTGNLQRFASRLPQSQQHQVMSASLAVVQRLREAGKKLERMRANLTTK